MKKDLIRRITLTEKEMPTVWYNIQADIDDLPEYLHPETLKPISEADLAPIFPPEIIKQELSKERYIEIPDEVQDIYHTYRPTPLHRAYGLERVLGTPAKIYYKYEGGNATNMRLSTLVNLLSPSTYTQPCGTTCLFISVGIFARSPPP